MADDRLARGDVSLQMDHSVIDDLLSHRLEEIAQYVFGRSTRDSDLLIDEEASAILASDAMPPDAADAALSDPSESAGESSTEEPASVELQSLGEDQAIVSELEQQVMEEAVDTPQDFDSATSTDQSDQDVEEDQTTGDVSEIDDAEDSAQ